MASSNPSRPGMNSAPSNQVTGEEYNRFEKLQVKLKNPDGYYLEKDEYEARAAKIWQLLREKKHPYTEGTYLIVGLTVPAGEHLIADETSPCSAIVTESTAAEGSVRKVTFVCQHQGCPKPSFKTVNLREVGVHSMPHPYDCFRYGHHYRTTLNVDCDTQIWLVYNKESWAQLTSVPCHLHIALSLAEFCESRKSAKLLIRPHNENFKNFEKSVPRNYGWSFTEVEGHRETMQRAINAINEEQTGASKEHNQTGASKEHNQTGASKEHNQSYIVFPVDMGIPKNAVTSDDDEWVTRHEWNIRDHGEGASFAMLLPKGNANGDNRIQYDKGKWEKLIVCNVLFDLRKRQKVSIKGFDGLLLVAFELTQIIEFFSKFVKSDPQITPGKLAELWYNCALKVTVKEKVISHAIKEYEQVNKTKFKWEKYSCTMHECPHVVLGPKLGYMVIDPLDESGHHGNT